MMVAHAAGKLTVEALLKDKCFSTVENMIKQEALKGKSFLLIDLPTVCELFGKVEIDDIKEGDVKKTLTLSMLLSDLNKSGYFVDWKCLLNADDSLPSSWVLSISWEYQCQMIAKDAR